MRIKLSGVIRYFFLSVMLVFALFPLLQVYINSLRTNTAVKLMPIGFSGGLSFQNYPDTWNIGGYGIAYFNSLFNAFLVIVFVLALFVWYAGKWTDPRTLSPRSLLFLSLSALATGASWVCYFRALQVGDASKVAPVDKFSLVLVALFAFMFLGERPSVREWVGIGLVAGGVLVLAIKR